MTRTDHFIGKYIYTLSALAAGIIFLTFFLFNSCKAQKTTYHLYFPSEVYVESLTADYGHEYIFVGEGEAILKLRKEESMKFRVYSDRDDLSVYSDFELFWTDNKDEHLKYNGKVFVPGGIVYKTEKHKTP